MIRLLLLTVLEILVFAGALVGFLNRIARTLEKIGGQPTSWLDKIDYGVRAIDKETSHLAPQVTQLNRGLGNLAGKLALVDAQLAATASALSAGKEEHP